MKKIGVTIMAIFIVGSLAMAQTVNKGGQHNNTQNGKSVEKASVAPTQKLNNHSAEFRGSTPDAVRPVDQAQQKAFSKSGNANQEQLQPKSENKSVSVKRQAAEETMKEQKAVVQKSQVKINEVKAKVNNTGTESKSNNNPELKREKTSQAEKRMKTMSDSGSK
ncbi:MAG: hypothetical protein KBB11_03120 [Bacteroidales bacterium]|nr:hypothetical protein [Bacteroidales bacterium]HQP03645.1 hypothetical protein [Bacteroidales bacterium]